MSLPELAKRFGVGQLLVKDESHRFGLNAFKALGSTYAVYHFIKNNFEELSLDCPESERFYREINLPEETFTFCTATDGNHGRGVAWVARKLRQKAVIYMPKDTVHARIENIRKEGAEVIVVDGLYDDAVRKCRDDAEKNSWQVISDTGWTGYEKIPTWIQAGYLTMFEEIHTDASINVDIVIVQTGVGALAAAAAWYYNTIHPTDRPKLVSVEPVRADCVMQSIQSEQGEPLTIKGEPSSIMAGLNCGTPSSVAWPFVKQGFDLFMTITDDTTRNAMRMLYHPGVSKPAFGGPSAQGFRPTKEGRDSRIVSGESGAAGLAALMTLTKDPTFVAARTFLQLDSNSSVLIINTEGDTDPIGFREIVE
jgi:diaminopropionate ammonia-lyase